MLGYKDRAARGVAMRFNASPYDASDQALSQKLNLQRIAVDSIAGLFSGYMRIAADAPNT
jgi:hypothetical protein